MLRKFTVALAAFGLALSIGVATPTFTVAKAAAQTHRALPYAADCVARNNPSETADTFISRCRKGSIRREFPSEYLSRTLGVIRGDSSATGKKAWKLVNDNRFKK